MKDVIDSLNPNQRAFLVQVATDAQEVLKQRDELLEALEECVGFISNLDGIHPEFAGEEGRAFVAGFDGLIARVKACALIVANSETQEGK